MGLLLFCLLLLFLLSVLLLLFLNLTYVHTKKVTRNELARHTMGTIFLVLPVVLHTLD